MDFLVIFSLILLNGVFAMAETAVVASRNSKLKLMAKDGSENAQAALELSSSPNRFLSTIQIGITLIAIFAGAFGEATIASSFEKIFSSIPFISSYANALALVVVVAGISFLSLVFGELFPKRVALSSPEKIATIVAKPMNLLSILARPGVNLLSNSTDFLLNVFGIKHGNELPVSEEEIRMLIKDGARAGVFNHVEKNIFERIFRLGDKKVSMIMTPKHEVVWIDIKNTDKEIRTLVTKNPFSYYPVCDDSLDKVVGLLLTEEALTHFLTDKEIDLKKLLHKPIFIPESMEAIKVLELFKVTGIHMAIVIDEYGGMMGILSLTDVLEEIVGDIPSLDEVKDKDILERKDGTFLVDGLVSVSEFKEFFNVKKIPEDKTGSFQTVGGFVMDMMDKIPVPGDNFEWERFYFEVMDMDKNRVDKVLIKKI